MTRGEHLGLLLPAFALLLLLYPGSAYGRAYGTTPTVLDSFERADFVVVARAVAVEKTDKAAPAGSIGDGENYVDGVKSTTMRVERVYKGDLKVGAELVFAQGSGAGCDWTFNEKSVGQQFLFYLSAPRGGSKVWYGFRCGRSSALESAGDDLLYLNKLDKVRGKTRLSGKLNFGDDGRTEVADRLIRVVGGKKSYEARTDAAGVYEIYDLPPGTYAVEPEIPAGWKVSGTYLSYSPSVVGAEGGGRRRAPTRISVKVGAGRHASLDLHFDIDNAIRGRIADFEGRPMNGVCLDLVPADGSKVVGAYLGACAEEGGAFEIDEIPPGRYVIVVNDDGKISSSEPFKTFYHPNATRREDAMVFEIGRGDFVEDVQVLVPAGEEVVTVEGVLLLSDGKPLAGEIVRFTAAGMDGGGETRGDIDGDASAATDEKGHFKIKILRGLKGSLRGEVYTYVGQFENCPELDGLIKQTGRTDGKMQTPAVEIQADGNVYDVELRFPFPGCKKARQK